MARLWQWVILMVMGWMLDQYSTIVRAFKRLNYFGLLEWDPDMATINTSGRARGMSGPELRLAPKNVQQIHYALLAASAGVGRRTCERWFMRAAMPSPRHFLAAARVLYAHRLLQDPGFTVEDVAKRLGYSQVRTLQQHARLYLGLTAGEMRLSLTPEAALQEVARRFLTLPHADVQAGAS